VRVEADVDVTTAADVVVDAELNAVAQGAGLALCGRVVGNVLRYGSHLLIARLLGVEAFGVFVLGVAVYQWMEMCAGLGLPQGVVRYVSIYQRGQDHQRLKGVLRDVWRLTLGVGIGLGLLLYLTAPLLAQGIFSEPRLTDVLRIFALGLPFGAAGLVVAMATTGFQTTRYLVYIREFFQPLAYIAWLIVFYLVGFGLSGVAGAWSLAGVLTFLLSLHFLREVFPAMRERSVRPLSQRWPLLRFSLPLWLAGMSGFTLMWADTFMLGYFRAASEVGLYRAAAQTALLLTIALTALNTIFSPKIAALYHGGEIEKLARLFKTTARWSFSLTLPGFILLMAAGEEVLSLFGPEFSGAWIPLVILAGAQLINAATGSVGFLLSMTGKSYHYLVGELVLMGVNILLNALLIPRWGLLGAALATGASIAGVNLLRLLQVYRLLRFHPYDRSYLKSLGAGGATGLGAWALSLWLPELHFALTLGITALAVGGTYLLVLSLLGFSPEDRGVWKALWGRLRPQ
jgi:O-antigen/teichoic acid export membrane protein